MISEVRNLLQIIFIHTIIGGISEELGNLNGTELVSKEKKFLNGPMLPENRSCHCMTSLNESFSVIIGGLVSGEISNGVLIYNTTDFSHNNGPSLIFSRYGHTCGIFNKYLLK